MSNPFGKQAIDAKRNEIIAKQRAEEAVREAELEAFRAREKAEEPLRRIRREQKNQKIVAEIQDSLARNGRIYLTESDYGCCLGRVSARDILYYSTLDREEYAKVSQDLRQAGYNIKYTGSDKHYSDDGAYGDTGSTTTVDYLTVFKN